jgi:hypothetical protein
VSITKIITTATATVAIVGAGIAAAPASACACETDNEAKQVARWPLQGGEQLDITANRHTTRRAARAVGDAWLDSSAWSPGSLAAAGKHWTRTHASKYRSLSRHLVYRNGRAKVNLYWLRNGAG